MHSDVQSKRVTATGSLAVGPARIRKLYFVASAAGRVTITDGDGGGTVIDLDTQAAGTFDIDIPNSGLRCEADVFVATLTSVTAVTIVYS